MNAYRPHQLNIFLLLPFAELEWDLASGQKSCRNEVIPMTRHSGNLPSQRNLSRQKDGQVTRHTDALRTEPHEWSVTQCGGPGADLWSSTELPVSPGSGSAPPSLWDSLGGLTELPNFSLYVPGVLPP